MVFEDEFARIVDELPSLTIGGVTKSINFNWGTETVLANYLTLAGTDAFPLIWCVEGEDTNDLREPSVKRNARIVILHQSNQQEAQNYPLVFVLEHKPYRKYLKPLANSNL